MSLTASARRVGATLEQQVDVNGRHTIVTDEPLDLGGTDAGPAPHELLPAALAACVGTMTSLYAQRRDWQLGEVVVDVDYEPTAIRRHFDVTIQFAGNLSAEQVERLTRVAATCPVRRALEAGCTFEERVVLTPAASPPLIPA